VITFGGKIGGVRSVFGQYRTPIRQVTALALGRTVTQSLPYGVRAIG
jgi:hypothetical protein